MFTGEPTYVRLSDEFVRSVPVRRDPSVPGIRCCNATFSSYPCIVTATELCRKNSLPFWAGPANKSEVLAYWVVVSEVIAESRQRPSIGLPVPHRLARPDSSKIPSFLWSSSVVVLDSSSSPPPFPLGTSLLPSPEEERREEQRSRDGPRPARAPGPPHPPLLLRRRHPLRASPAGGHRARQGSPRFSARRPLRRRRRFRTRGLY